MRRARRVLSSISSVFGLPETTVLGKSRVVLRGFRVGAGLERHIVDNDLTACDAGDSDGGGVAGEGPVEDKNVVVVEGGVLPRPPPVAAHLQLGGSIPGVFDRRGEPELGRSAVHPNPQGLRLGHGTSDPLPLDAVDSTPRVCVGEFGPSVGGHVQMRGVASSQIRNLQRCKVTMIASAIGPLGPNNGRARSIDRVSSYVP